MTSLYLKIFLIALNYFKHPKLKLSIAMINMKAEIRNKFQYRSL